MKDIEIERLKRKATKDSEHLVEQVKILEDRLQEKQDEVKGLRDDKIEAINTINRLKA